MKKGRAYSAQQLRSIYMNRQDPTGAKVQAHNATQGHKSAPAENSAIKPPIEKHADPTKV